MVNNFRFGSSKVILLVINVYVQKAQSESFEAIYCDGDT